MKRRGWQRENKSHELASNDSYEAVLVEKEQVMCLLHSLMGEGRWTKLGDGMSKGDFTIIKLYSLLKLLLLDDLLNQGIKLKVEPTWILSHGNSRIMLLKLIYILPHTFAVGLMIG